MTHTHTYCCFLIYIYIYTHELHAYYMQYPYIWVNYNDLTATSLEIMVSKGNHPQMGLNLG